MGLAGTPSEMEASAQAGGSWVRSDDLTVRACVGSSGRVFRLTWSNGGQASGQSLFKL